MRQSFLLNNVKGVISMNASNKSKEPLDFSDLTPKMLLPIFSENETVYVSDDDFSLDTSTWD